MSEYEQQKKWSDKFIRDIKRNLGECLITEPRVEEDRERNTDLIVLKFDSVRIACRVRKFGYFAEYKNEFTIRSSLQSGYKTELAKIVEGWGDYLFYAFANEKEDGLHAWRLLSLSTFRLWFMRECCKLNANETPGRRIKNFDGLTGFHVFDVSKIEKIVIAESGF